MSFKDKTMFEVCVPDGQPNTSGKFGTYAEDKYTAADCSAGHLCVQKALIPNDGYQDHGIYNGNHWYFDTAKDGTVGGKSGDSTGIFAFNNYDVQKAVSGDNKWNLGAKTLGLGLPAGEDGDFRELIVGKQYKFGKGNFATAPTDIKTQKYATIQDGLLVAASAMPTTGGEVYFKILRTTPVNQGARFWGDGYVMLVCRAKSATAAQPAEVKSGS